eukprot:TRINITY_DN955_c2_g1_i1.p1 TRINITY_DN955_c2_g1~~TRINITY_DN955_c2_g1_i1.p1  ORF type:complete len:821 (+),score=135.90 TRINITY_DN955_c2_g1_i1:76-2463(+)
MRKVVGNVAYRLMEDEMNSYWVLEQVGVLPTDLRGVDERRIWKIKKDKTRGGKEFYMNIATGWKGWVLPADGWEGEPDERYLKRKMAAGLPPKPSAPSEYSSISGEILNNHDASLDTMQLPCFPVTSFVAHSFPMEPSTTSLVPDVSTEPPVSDFDIGSRSREPSASSQAPLPNSPPRPHVEPALPPSVREPSVESVASTATSAYCISEVTDFDGYTEDDVLKKTMLDHDIALCRMEVETISSSTVGGLGMQMGSIARIHKEVVSTPSWEDDGELEVSFAEEELRAAAENPLSRPFEQLYRPSPLMQNSSRPTESENSVQSGSQPAASAPPTPMPSPALLSTSTPSHTTLSTAVQAGPSGVPILNSAQTPTTASHAPSLSSTSILSVAPTLSTVPSNATVTHGAAASSLGSTSTLSAVPTLSTMPSNATVTHGVAASSLGSTSALSDAPTLSTVPSNATATPEAVHALSAASTAASTITSTAARVSSASRTHTPTLVPLSSHSSQPLSMASSAKTSSASLSVPSSNATPPIPVVPVAMPPTLAPTTPVLSKRQAFPPVLLPICPPRPVTPLSLPSSSPQPKVPNRSPSVDAQSMLDDLVSSGKKEARAWSIEKTDEQRKNEQLVATLMTKIENLMKCQMDQSLEVEQLRSDLHAARAAERAAEEEPTPVKGGFKLTGRGLGVGVFQPPRSIPYEGEGPGKAAPPSPSVESEGLGHEIVPRSPPHVAPPPAARRRPLTRYGYIEDEFKARPPHRRNSTKRPTTTTTTITTRKRLHPTPIDTRKPLRPSTTVDKPFR